MFNSIFTAKVPAVSAKPNHSRQRRQSTRRISGHSRLADYNTLEPRRLLAGTPGPDGDPNDQICESPAVLADGQTRVFNSLSPNTDVDLFEITITSTSKQYVFTANGYDQDGDGDLDLDTYLRLFDASGTQIDQDDDITFGNTDSQIEFTFSATGTYYLGVSAEGNESYSAVTGEGDDSGDSMGRYDLTFHDSDDQIDEVNGDSNVNKISLGGARASQIDRITDVDLYEFSGVSGQSVEFLLDGDGNGANGLDAYLRLFDDAGNELQSDDDNGGNLDSKFTFTFTSTDNYYLGVSNFLNGTYDSDDGTGDTTSNSPTNATGFYTLTATEVSLDVNDRRSNAINLGNLFFDGTRTSSGEIDVDADVDLYTFQVSRDGSFVEIDVDVPTLGLDSLIRLFDFSGAEIDSNEDANAPGETGAFPRDSFIGRFLNSGTYFVGVSAFQNTDYDIATGLGDTDGNSTGSYTIDIQDRLHVDSTSDQLITPITTSNDSQNILREAIEFANDQPGHQTITFQPSDFATPRTIRLTNQLDNDQLEITDSVTIDGPGADLLELNGDDNSRVLLIDNDDDNTEIDVTIRGVTIKDGNTTAGSIFTTSEKGAGIFNSENLTLENVAVESNRIDVLSAVGGLLGDNGNDGGGLFHRVGDLIITGSTFSGNSALNGGGVLVQSGTAEIINSTFHDNTVRAAGGGILVEGASTTVTIRNSTITGNRGDDDDSTSNDQPGGIARSGAMVTLHNTLVAGNFDSTGTNEVIGDVFGTLSSASSHNLIGQRDSGVSLNNGINGNIVGDGNGGDLPLASILQQIGTEFFLTSTSPAVNAGSNSEAIDANGAPLTTDQFDNTRIQFATVDIGSRESGFDNEMPSLVVTTTDDVVNQNDFETSLREAIAFANDLLANGDGDADNDDNPIDTITFAPSLSGTITTDSQLVISSSVTIDGPGANLLTISGGTGNNHRVFEVSDLDDANLLNVEINGVTIRDGGNASATIEGAGIQNAENLTLRNVAIESNAGGTAGGIAHFLGQLNVIDSTISGNSAGERGGGIAVSSGSAVITNSTFSGNSANGIAGGIIADAPTIVRNSTFTGNRADADGDGDFDSGAFFANPSILTLHNSIVAGNFHGTGTSPSGVAEILFVAGSSNNLIGSAGVGPEGLTNGLNGNIVGVGGSGTIPIGEILNTTLANNGGTTQTHALVDGSLAINAGSNQQVVSQVQASLVQPSSVTTNTVNDFRPVGNLISNNGLNILNYDSTPEPNNGDSWVTDGSGSDYFVAGTDPVLGFDLGITQTLEQVAIWGYKEFANNDIKDFTLEFSTDGGSTFNSSVSLTKPKYTAAGFVNELNLGGTFDANFVRMTITDNYNGDRVGFHEIRFLTEAIATDQRGEARIKRGTVDIGAFESDFIAGAPKVTGAVRDGGGVLARPDLLTTFAVTFDQNVIVDREDLIIRNDTLGGGSISTLGVGFSYSLSTRTATWNFSSLVLTPAFYSFELTAGITGPDAALAPHVESIYVALPGDANLDGKVDVLGDAFALVGNLGTTGGATWAQGDFNGDGNVSVLGDAFILVGKLGQDVRPLATTTSFAMAQFQSAPATANSSVTTSLPLEQTSNVDDQDEVSTDSNLTTTQSESPQLVLAGDDGLRDDVFGSDF